MSKESRDFDSCLERLQRKYLCKDRSLAQPVDNKSVDNLNLGLYIKVLLFSSVIDGLSEFFFEVSIAVEASSFTIMNIRALPPFPLLQDR